MSINPFSPPAHTESTKPDFVNALLRLTEGEEAALAAVILRGPEPDRDGCCAWTCADLCPWMAAHFGKSYHPSSMTRVAAPNGVLAPEGTPRTPAARHKSPGALRKKGLDAALK